MLKKLFGVFLIALGILFLLGNIFSLNVSKGWFFGPAVSVNEQQAIDASGIESIQVESDIASIHITESQGSQIVAQLNGELSEQWKDQYQFRTKKNGSKLEVYLQLPSDGDFGFPFPGFHMKSIELNLSVPSKLYKELRVQTDVGKIEVDQLRANRLELQTDVGKVSVQGFTGGEAELKTDVGLIEVRDSDAEWNIRSSTGKVDVRVSEIKQDMEIQTDTGMVVVVSEESLEAVELSLRSDVGKVQTNVDGLDIQERSDQEVRATKGISGPNIEIQTDVGRIEFNTH